MKSHLLKISGIALFVFLASGSATNQERLANRQQTCANSFGYSYGSDAMAQCVERMARQADQNQQKVLYCLSAFQLGSPAYNACLNR
jgi:hypothetical protein